MLYLLNHSAGFISALHLSFPPIESRVEGELCVAVPCPEVEVGSHLTHKQIYSETVQVPWADVPVN